MSKESELLVKRLKNLNFKNLCITGLYCYDILMEIAKTKYRVEEEFDTCVTDLETHKTEPGPLIIPKHIVFNGTEEDCKYFMRNTSEGFVKDVMNLDGFITVNINKFDNGLSIYYRANACEGKNEITAMITYTISSMLD